MNKKLLRENINNTIYNKFRFACENEEEFNMFMNGINRYLQIYEDEIEELEANNTEKDKLLNQYPYKNEPIEEKYENIKRAFSELDRTPDNIEHFNYLVDARCEEHKARIRDIENHICIIEQLEKNTGDKNCDKCIALHHNLVEKILELSKQNSQMAIEKLQDSISYLNQIKERDNKILDLEAILISKRIKGED